MLTSISLHNTDQRDDDSQTGHETTFTTCVHAALGKRQSVSIGASVHTSSAIPTPSGLQGASPSRISVVCACLGPPTPSPVTATATKTATSVYTQSVNVVVTRSGTFIVTPTITAVSRFSLVWLREGSGGLMVLLTLVLA